MNNVGKDEKDIGTVSNAGRPRRLLLRRVIRAVRISEARTRRDWASGVPNLAVCCNVLTTARIPSELVRVLRLSNAIGGRGERSVGSGDGELFGSSGDPLPSSRETRIKGCVPG